MFRKSFIVITIVLLVSLPAQAATWLYSGAISDCNEPLCELVPLVVGDPVNGQLSIDVGANDSFLIPPGFSDFEFNIGAFSIDPVNLDFSGSTGTTDANGDFASGVLNGVIVGGQLAGLGGAFVVDLVSGDVQLTVANGTVFVTSVAGSFTLQPVPVPAAVWLFGSAILGLAGLTRRTKD